MKSLENLHKYAEYWNKHSLKEVCDFFGIVPETALRKSRRCRELGIFTKKERNRSDFFTDIKKSKLLQQATENLSEEEIKILLNDIRIKKDTVTRSIDFNKSKINIGIISDTHIGHVNFNPDYLKIAFDEFSKQNVDCIFHTGDVTEGLMKAHGHVYELTHIGYKEQKQYAVELLSQSPANMFLIDGNHDRRYVKIMGGFIVEDIVNELNLIENNKIYTYLGSDEGSVFINDIEFRLFHGEDGASYAQSYRLQKLVETMKVNTRPSVLITGHDHKAMYMPEEQGVHTIAAGCLQEQTKWMRSKRISAKTGFWIITVFVDEGKIVKLIPQWHTL